MILCPINKDSPYKVCIRRRDLFIGPHEFVVGYSKAPEQPQSSARPICHSHTMTRTGREPATIRIAAYRSSPSYALRHGRLLNWCVTYTREGN